MHPRIALLLTAMLLPFPSPGAESGVVAESVGPSAIGPQSSYADLLHAAEAGGAEAQYLLAIAYEEGAFPQTPSDPTRAIAWLEKAGNQGHVLSQYHLGCLYDNGGTVAKDPRLAVHWYRKAAEAGYAQAQCNLANRLLHGEEGVPSDPQQAIAWYRKSAAQGRAEAQCNLGYCYFNGRGVDLDRV